MLILRNEEGDREYKITKEEYEAFYILIRAITHT